MPPTVQQPNRVRAGFLLVGFVVAVIAFISLVGWGVLALVGSGSGNGASTGGPPSFTTAIGVIGTLGDNGDECAHPTPFDPTKYLPSGAVTPPPDAVTCTFHTSTLYVLVYRLPSDRKAALTSGELNQNLCGLTQAAGTPVDGLQSVAAANWRIATADPAVQLDTLGKELDAQATVEPVPCTPK